MKKITGLSCFIKHAYIEQHTEITKFIVASTTFFGSQ